MFKLALILLGLSVVALARPGGETGHYIDHGIGHIHAPNKISHADSHAHIELQVPEAAKPYKPVVTKGDHVHVPQIKLPPPHIPHLHQIHPKEEEVHHHQHPAPHVHVHPILTQTVITKDHYVPIPVKPQHKDEWSY